jgi:RimJ/RimL family protein N-acetyltransferase
VADAHGPPYPACGTALARCSERWRRTARYSHQRRCGIGLAGVRRSNEVPQAAARGKITAMPSSYWPLTGLRLRTPQLELRLPSQPDLEALADLAAAGVHDPDMMPFNMPWTDAPPDERALSTMQYHWSRWAAWKPSEWSLELVVLRGGTVVGTQGIGAREFAVLREVHTGSWLGRTYHGQGIGTQMRAAVLHLAFEGLGAQQAVSGAFEDNGPSLGVSYKLGYRDDGIALHAVRGRPAVQQRLRLTRDGWLATRSVPVEIDGLAPCLPMFGVPPAG